MIRHTLLILLSLASLTPLACSRRPARPAATRPALPHSAYVWQRKWTPAVSSAVASPDPHLSQLVVLAAEISFRAGRPSVARASLDYDALKQSHLPVGLAIRIGPYPGPFNESDDITRLLSTLATSLLADAHSHGLHISELQLDFDAAESKLDGYRTWLTSLRPAISPCPLTITTLPSWQNAPAFPRLLAATDGYVLQVHSTQRPTSPDTLPKLCDPDKALAWTRRASQFGVPFRLALPTYSYLVGFSDTGKLLGLSAEGPLPSWPPTAKLRLLAADPAELAHLLHTLCDDPPPHLAGIIWYRLPTTQDTMNFSPVTFSALLAGRTPQPHLAVTTTHTAGGPTDILLSNTGDADASLSDFRITLTTPDDADILASDTLNNFTRTSSTSHSIVLAPPADTPPRRLPPNTQLPVAWLRLSQDKEVESHVETLPR